MDTEITEAKSDNVCSRSTCPYYETDMPAAWGLSPEGWDRAKKNHDQNH